MPRVLVVEDSATQAEQLRIVLDGAGFEVDVAQDGEEGLGKAESERFDLVVSDILLPGMSGYELCRAIKERRAGLPVVLVTSLQEPRALLEALESGADSFVTKPYHPRYLVGRLERLLETRAAQPNEGRPSQAPLTFLGEQLERRLDQRQVLGLLASAYEEAVRRTEELQSKNEQLELLQSQKDDLSAFIVHDLKNPLNDIEMRMQMLMRRDSLSERDRRSVQVARGACQTMNRMVLNLLDVSRAEDVGLTVKPEEVPLSALIGEVVDAMALEAHTRRQQVVSRAPSELAVRVDRALMVRVLENLVENGLKYGPDDGTVELGASRTDDGAVELRVTDRGPGIPQELREKIFDKYAQLERDAAARGRRSRGLGLAFCRLAVEAHGGTLTVEDNDPTGCVFRVHLPTQG